MAATACIARTEDRDRAARSRGQWCDEITRPTAKRGGRNGWPGRLSPGRSGGITPEAAHRISSRANDSIGGFQIG